MIETIIMLGLISSAVYALLSIGFTLVYGVANVINMSHGAFFMFGAYMFFVFGPFGFFELDPIVALILATIVVGIMGAIIYGLVIHPVVEDAIASIVVTLGAAMILQQIIYIEFGGAHRAVPPFISGSIIILGTPVTYSKITALVVSLALITIIAIFITKAKIGKAMRAVSQDREVAMLMGINTTGLYILTMAMSASLAAIAGIFIASSTTQVAEPHMWLNPLGMAFAIVILGGLGSIKGTVIGAFIVGYAETAVTILIPGGSFLRGAVALTIMVAVLLLRPKGLFGKRIELEE
jgi:branched-chain amino acid transport system permease protein